MFLHVYLQTVLSHSDDHSRSTAALFNHENLPTQEDFVIGKIFFSLKGPFEKDQSVTLKIKFIKAFLIEKIAMLNRL